MTIADACYLGFALGCAIMLCRWHKHSHSGFTVVVHWLNFVVLVAGLAVFLLAWAVGILPRPGTIEDVHAWRESGDVADLAGGRR